MRTLAFVPGSPFARKVRIVLVEKGLEFEARSYDTFPPPPEIRQINPSLLVPVLIDEEIELFESNLIIEYILATYAGAALGSPDPSLASAMARTEYRWHDAKVLATIETMANSLVSLSYMTWSGLQETKPNLIGLDLFSRLEERISSCLDYLEGHATPEGFIPGQFSVQDIALMCPLMWTDARLMFPWRGRPNLEAIIAFHANRPSVLQSAVPPWPPIAKQIADPS
jgi:glutathione S-transferase